MKIRYWAAGAAVLTLLALAGCAMGTKAAQSPSEQTTQSTLPPSTATAPQTTTTAQPGVSSQPTTEPTTEPTTVPPTQPAPPPTTQPATKPTEPPEPTSGWVKRGGKQYYILDNGELATGKVEIDGKIRYFTATGEHIILANPWNYIPDSYDPDLIKLSTSVAVEDCYVDRVCYDDLMAMIRDCNRECPSVYVVSGYRTYEHQKRNFERKVKIYMDAGYSREEAERLAGMVNARPGTSEHQLGLAVDFVDTRYWTLDEKQAELPAQKWLMEHCWEYGFILRYPSEKSEITGIIYEPWHYRYVGREIALEIRDAGLTLEEYLETL
jgi:LAS superfamily LD-carboxypeptidase LdcB